MQIIEKEKLIEEAQLQQKYIDKEQVDAIVDKIIQEEINVRENVAESKKQQFTNMVDSLWLKNQNLKKQKEMEQQAYEEAVNFQRILDNRALQLLSKEKAANEFKDKVYAQIEQYIKQKKAMDEARDIHFKELGDAKY